MKPSVAIICCLLAQPLVFGQNLDKSKDGSPKTADTKQAGDSAGVVGPAKKAFEAYNSGKHEDAIALAKPLAEKGDADAIYLLGFAHETGNGTTASAEKAMEYYRKGMAKGHADSIYRLAFMLMATQDKTQILEAQAILEKQAQKEPAIAGRILGEAFLQGRFTEQPDLEKALKWWEKASEAGDIASMLFIARFYDGQMGFLDKRDPGLAMKYFTMASDAGNPSAMVAVGSRLLFGESAEKDEKRAFALLKKAIENKDYSAHFALGTYQERVKKDSKAALAEFELGTKAENPESMIMAAEYLMAGKGTEKDLPRAIKILEAAAKAGNAQAHLMLAAQALQAKEPDIISGYQHLLAASNTGFAAAQNELGLFYLSGKLGMEDVSAAVSWFGRAAQSGFAASQNNLAALHERGTGVPQSYETAAQLYALAAQQGHPGATLALARFQAAGAATKVNKERAWALAKIAEDSGEANAPEFLKLLEKDFSEKQLAAAKEELKRITSGKSDEE